MPTNKQQQALSTTILTNPTASTIHFNIYFPDRLAINRVIELKAYHQIFHFIGNTVSLETQLL